MPISSCRIRALQETLAAWDLTGFPFLRLRDGIITPLENGFGSDAELFYFVPWVARTFSVSIEQALWWWDVSCVALGVFIACAGFWQLTKTWLERTIAVLGVVGIAAVAYSVGDTYLAPFFACAFIPWIFVCLEKKSQGGLLAFSFVVGFVVSFVNAIRLFGGWSLGTIFMCVVLFSVRQLKKTVFVAALLFCGMGMYHLWFNSVMKERNGYLQSQGIAYGNHDLQHAFWHSIYLGLGFISNDYNIIYNDSCALKRAREVQPTIVYCSPEYDALLRDEVFTMCMKHPNYVIRVLWAKAGILFYYLLLFANLGLLAAFFYRKLWYIDLSYACALGFAALPGLATIPIIPYLIGFCTIATFYGIHSIIYALQRGALFSKK